MLFGNPSQEKDAEASSEPSAIGTSNRSPSCCCRTIPARHCELSRELFVDDFSRGILP
uniref:Uncharacterized protein n=1 Tax=Utricularia reniformis TaxID=192314 RepID=A0A1Y0B3S6_9LAMI|nr:hypothetical protein AEK19_MT1808 [Utricularia reniformis]ART31979.1 hypothetical protein AEK19_MT1808 [Utricularia reniformis]